MVVSRMTDAMFSSITRLASAVFHVVWDAVEGFNRDRAMHLAAAMAFYSMFAVAPLILIVTAVSGLLFGPETARVEVINQIGLYVGPEAKEFIERILENWRDPSAGIWATIIGTVTTLYFAFRVFDALRDTLDTVWGVRVRTDISWGEMIWQYARSFLTMLLVVPVFLFSTLLSEVVTRLGPRIERWLGIDMNLGMVTFFLISIVLLTMMFAVIYKWLPDVYIQWRDVFFGALVTAVLFSVGRMLIALYVAQATTASLFGAAGSLVVLLFWIYYSAQILYLGAELTQVYAERYGHGIEPDHTAVKYGGQLRKRGDQGQ